MAASVGIWRGHVGVATETVYGSTATAPWAYIPVISYDDYTEDMGLVMDDAYRGAPAKVFGVYSGMQQGKVGLTVPYYPNQVARFFPKLMGTDSIGSSSNGGWQHNFLANSSGTPTSDTVFWFYGSTTLGDRTFSGLQWQALDFKFSRASGMATAKLTGIGAAPTTAFASENTPSYSSDPALRGWQATFAIGGTTNAQLIDFELNVSREVELVFAANNSQRPAFAEVGALDAKGKMTFYGSTDLPLLNYRNNTQNQLDLLLIDTVGGSTINRLEITGNKVVFNKVTPSFKGKFLQYEVEFQCINNTSAGGDSGPFQCITTVATSSSYIA